MKICLYLEFYKFWGGILYKNIGTGLLSSYHNQKKILNAINVPFVESWDDSCDILQINTPWLKSLWLIRKAKKQGKKVIIWSHVTAEDFRQVFRINAFFAPLMKKYLTYAYGQADLVFAPSLYTKTLLVAYGLPAEKIIPQSNGVDNTKFIPDKVRREEARKEYKLDGQVVGTVGLAIPRKGINTFLFLAGKFGGNKFPWFGKIYSSFLVKALPKDTPKNVQFTGYVKDIVAAFNALEIFIFPSYEENQGMVILEAAAVGLPVLVRDIPAYGGWLIHEKNCLKAKDDAEFEKYLKEMLGDPELRRKLSEGALKLAEEHSLAEIAEKTRSIYENLLTDGFR